MPRRREELREAGAGGRGDRLLWAATAGRAHPVRRVAQEARPLCFAHPEVLRSRREAECLPHGLARHRCPPEWMPTGGWGQGMCVGDEGGTARLSTSRVAPASPLRSARCRQRLPTAHDHHGLPRRREARGWRGSIPTVRDHPHSFGFWDPIRSDERFTQLLDKMDLTARARLPGRELLLPGPQ